MREWSRWLRRMRIDHRYEPRSAFEAGSNRSIIPDISIDRNVSLLPEARGPIWLDGTFVHVLSQAYFPAAARSKGHAATKAEDSKRAHYKDEVTNRYVDLVPMAMEQRAAGINSGSLHSTSTRGT